MESGTAVKDRRGGSRVTTKQLESTRSIVQFIKKLEVVSSHYGRGHSSRQYLPSNLSITKLYEMWKAEQKAQNLPVPCRFVFAEIFRTKFNLSFCTPNIDLCSFCEEMGNKTNCPESRAALKLHKTRAKRFYEILRESASLKDCLTITFDVQQNQPLPKTNVGEAYYCRQLWLYTFGVVIHRKFRKPVSKDRARKNVFLYTWLESDSGKGSNEIVSALSHFFDHVVKKKIARQRYTRIRLFSDCCPGQNKNTAMLFFLMRLMQDRQIQRFIPVIEYFFPIKGHSYLPPDRIFAKIEKRLRKMPVIKTPAEYQQVLEEHGNVLVLGDDWNVYNMKELAGSALMSKSIKKLAISKNRVWTFTRKAYGQVSVRNQYATFINETIPLLKPGVNLKT